MKKAIVFLIAALALAIPTGAAFAQSPNAHQGTLGKSAPNVRYVLKGTLSGYIAFDSSTNTNGQVTILVKHSNRHGRALKDASLTFTLDASSRVTFKHTKQTTINDGDKGIITLRAPKRITGDLASQLPGLAKKIHVRDQQRVGHQ
jgi:hypothetical protein